VAPAYDIYTPSHINKKVLHAPLTIICLVPETKGGSLEHIERNLLSGKRLRDIGR
jgi:hypothetical protein